MSVSTRILKLRQLKFRIKLHILIRTYSFLNFIESNPNKP